jgi:hypothetical protein
MDNKFQIGDWCWKPSVRAEKSEEPCPICFGRLEVTLILGNGDQIVTECRYCFVGFDGPFGVVPSNEYYVGEAQLKQITGIDTRRADDGELEYTYWFGGVGTSGPVFKTAEEANEFAVMDAEQRRISWQERKLTEKHREYQSYSSNAGYFLERAEQARKDAERYEAKAKYMKSKARK